MARSDDAVDDSEQDERLPDEREAVAERLDALDDDERRSLSEVIDTLESDE